MSDFLFKVNLNVNQLEAVVQALKLYIELRIGNPQSITELFIDETIPVFTSDSKQSRPSATRDQIHWFSQTIDKISDILGYESQPEFSITDQNITDNTKTAYNMTRKISSHLKNDDTPDILDSHTFDDTSFFTLSSNDGTYYMTFDLKNGLILSSALDTYTRFGIGQLNIFDELIRFGDIPTNRKNPLSYDDMTNIKILCDELKITMGYPINGSHGIGNPHNDISVCRAYEIKKSIDRSIAYARNPNPDFKTVDYDGIGHRYTTDPEPVTETLQHDNTEGFSPC